MSLNDTDSEYFEFESTVGHSRAPRRGWRETRRRKDPGKITAVAHPRGSLR